MINASRTLFTARVLEQALDQHIEEHGLPAVEHLNRIREWHSRAERGMFDSYSETQLEQQFLNMLFIQLLGYVPVGGASHHIVPKRTGDSGKDIPDFVLGMFTPGTDEERWVAVGELKSLRTDLDAPQHHYPYETPVEQAFRYAMRGRQGVEWVIASNLDEIRLYRNGYLDAYHVWHLGELSEHRKLAEFHFLLRRPALIPDNGISSTQALLGKSLQVGLDITEGFYGLYALARAELIDHLSRSPHFKNAAAAHLYGKAHKILNRGLFAAYCEDHPAGLLPSNTLKAIHDKASSVKGKDGKYWKTFQAFFRELDKGSPPGSPYAYNAFNGGLFAPDPELDALNLPDDLFCRPFFYSARGKTSREMTGIYGFHVYDFANELNVDALGAIFEQSLKDLPTSDAPVRGRGSVAVTRRKQHGVYYTPTEITRFMVTRAFDAFVTPLRKMADETASKQPIKKVRKSKSKPASSAIEIRRKLYFQDMMERFRKIRLHDPACGSGAFLIEALRHFSEQYSSVNTGLSRAIGAKALFALDRFVLRHNLHGWDILEESTELAKLSIWLRTARPKEALEDLRNTISVADSLRSKESERFDIIVSNPPWGAELDGWTADEIRKEFPESGEEKDSYALFLMLAHSLLTEGGVVSYIMPNSWLTTVGYEAFRRWILDKFDILEIVNVWKVFTDVNHDACIVLLRKRAATEDEHPEGHVTHVRSLATGGTESAKCTRLAEEQWKYDFAVDATRWATEPGARFETIYEPRLADELDRAAQKSTPLGACCDITVGIQVYHHRKVDADVIASKAFHSESKRGADWFRYLTGNEVQRYFQVPSTTAFLKYSDDLCDKRELSHYKLPRVLVQQIFWNRIAACISVPREPTLYLNTLFSLTSPKDPYSLEYLLAVLNSRVMSACYGRWTNRLFGDKFPKVSKVDLARIPIPKPGLESMHTIAKCANDLAREWQSCKEQVTVFQEYLQVTDPSGKLVKALDRPWSLSREEAVQAIGSTRLDLSPDKTQELVRSWKDVVDKVSRKWDRICEYEDDVDSTVARSYGFSKAVRKELIERTPPCGLDDVLLPR